MDRNSRVVTTFFIDGEADGPIRAELDNWNGVIYRIPRRSLSDVSDREELCHSGVYLLLGNQEEDGKKAVYVGQACIRKNGESVVARCREHCANSGKNFFNEVVFLTTMKPDFGPTELCYLEHRLYMMAKDAGRYEVTNANEPGIGSVTEAKKAELDRYVVLALIILGFLGCDAFKPLVPLARQSASEQDRICRADADELILKRKIRLVDRDVYATALWTNEGIVVKAGSDIVLQDGDSLWPAMKVRRDKCIADHIITENTEDPLAAGKVGKLAKDQLFSGPTAAGVFVIGANFNGQTGWENKDGKSFKELCAGSSDEKQ